jgi:hypothetical protein
MNAPAIAHHARPRLSWDGAAVRIGFGPSLQLGGTGVRLAFEHRDLLADPPATVDCRDDTVVLAGSMADGAIAYRITWSLDLHGILHKQVAFDGRPPATWGRLVRLHVIDEPAPESGIDDQLGWRECPTGNETSHRSEEEGGGVLPGCGFPVFGHGFFAGLEHPCGVGCCQDGRLSLHHHPRWGGDHLESFPAAIGLVAAGSTAAEAFAAYLGTVRRPLPERAVVEICTFWTDLFDPSLATERRFATSLAGYRRLAEEWFERVLQGERGLVSSFLLDAGWQERDSLFQPSAANGGPGDQGLAELAGFLAERGFDLGLWWSWNGPMGVGDRWMETAGYRVSRRGSGAAYGVNAGATGYACLTDPVWEEAIGRRLGQLLDRTGARFIKDDWVNDGIEDPTLHPGILPSRAHMLEANAEVLMRLFRRAATGRPGVRFRGAWWMSPWWTLVVDATYLAHSGDCESSDVPSLTQRDAVITARDSLFFRNFVAWRTPFPWNAVNSIEFAAATRCPIADTEASWLDNLIMWCSRGSWYQQLYVSPYHLQGTRAWTLREVLRWYRRHEDILWRASQRMVGGDPARGEVYGYLHQQDRARLLTLRNPLPHPQPVPAGLDDTAGWQRLYPLAEPTTSLAGIWMPAHAVWLCRAGDSGSGCPDAFAHGKDGWLAPYGSARAEECHGRAGAVHPDHGIATCRLQRLEAPAGVCQFGLEVPWGYANLDWVFRVRLFDGRLPSWRVQVGRYADGHAAAALPVTWVRAHTEPCQGLRKVPVTPFPQDIAVLRVTAPAYGFSYLSVHGEPGSSPAAQIDSMWIEAQEILVPIHRIPPEELAALIPPSLPAIPRVLAHLIGERPC